MFGIPKKGEIDYSQVVELDLVDRAAQRVGPEAAGGPHQSRRHQEPLHGVVLEAGAGERLQQGGRRHGQAAHRPPTRHGRRQRRRPDRRDHLLHQYVQPVGAARRRPARQEGRRERHEAASARQDLDGARLQGRHRLPEGRRPAALPGATRLLRRRLRLHHLHGPGRTAGQGSRRHRGQERPDHARRCSPATATSKPACTKASRPTS